MLLGITETLQENNRIDVKKRIAVVTTIFLISLFLPFILFALFHFKIIPSKPTFISDIQEPVAKLINQDKIGTAFLVSQTKMLTARHMVENLSIGSSVSVIFEKAKSPINITAKVIYIAPTSSQGPIEGKVGMDYFLTDIAVLEVPAISDIEPLDLGESSSVNTLDDVVLIGYPNNDYSITKGSINSTSYQGLDLFKLDAASNPGNSGGPCILKEDNTVIGILVGGAGPNYQGENIAVKIDNIKRLLVTAGINISK
jgi:S1-C subfamily serine protease